MAIYGNLRDYRFEKDVDDIRGATVYGIDDEKLGTIEDVIFDSRSGELRYVVIDAGGWLTTKRFLVPAREVMNTTEGEDHYHINLRRDDIERFPEYREEDLRQEDRWNDYEQRYSQARDLTDGPVLHREGSTRTITPGPEEMPATGSSGRDVSSADLTPRRIAQDQPRFGATSDSEDVAYTGNLAAPEGAKNLQPEREIDKIRRKEEEPVAHTNEVDQRPFDSGRATVRNPEGQDGGRRFREFQERLRREREEILRRRREREAA